MANMIKDLLAPEQAKLLDDQLRKQSLQQGVTNYGSDAMGKFLTAASGAQRASAGFGMAAERAIAGRQMGANEMQATRAQKVKTDTINQAKQYALLSVEGNPTLDEEQKTKIIGMIKTSTSPSQLEAIAKRFGKATSGSTAVEKLSDGSVISVGNNGVTQVSPPSLAGFMGMTYNGLQDAHSSDSIMRAQQLYKDGLKNKITEDELRRQLTKTLQPNLNDLVTDNYVELTQTAKGYGTFDQGLPRTVEALNNANVGSLGGIKQFFGKAAEAIGLDLNSVEDTELINRILTKEVLNNAQFMKGTLSDKDIEFLKQTVGTQGTSLEGLKEAFVELAVRKEVAYKTSQEFNGLDNRSKNIFDFEGARSKYYKESREKYSEMFGMEKRKSDKVNVPPMLDRNSKVTPPPSQEDIIDFFSLPKR